MEEKSHHKIKEIEYLRALAIILTLFHHIVFYLYPYPQTNSFLVNLYSRFTFFSGVDLFFCISGFVIFLSFQSSLDCDGLQKKSYFKTTINFWKRRFFRLMPSAWLWIIIYLLLTKYFNSQESFGSIEQNLKDMKAAVLFYANIYGTSCWGQNRTQVCGPNGIYWSLSLEEQFYFILPFLIFLLGRGKNLILFLISLIGFQMILERPYWSLPWAMRVDSICIGLLIAMIYKSKFYINLGQLVKKLKLSFPLFTVLLLFLLIYVPAEMNQIPKALTLLSFVCGSIVLLASYNAGFFLPKIHFIDPVLSWLGARSYSLYLCHIVAFKLTYELLDKLWLLSTPISQSDFKIILPTALGLCFLFAELNFRLVEKPIRQRFLRSFN